MVTRLRRQGTVPSHLSDNDIRGLGSQRRFHISVPQNQQDIEQEVIRSEAPSRATMPISQDAAPDQSELTVEWEQMLEETKDDNEDVCHGMSQLSELSTRCQQSNQDNAALWHEASQISDLVTALKEMKPQNIELRQQFQRLATEVRAPSRSATPQPFLRSRLPPSTDNYVQYAIYSADRRE